MDERREVEGVVRTFFSTMAHEREVSSLASGPLVDHLAVLDQLDFRADESTLTIHDLRANHVGEDTAEVIFSASVEVSGRTLPLTEIQFTGPVRLVFEDDQWKVTDYARDGVSALDSYRALSGHTAAVGDVRLTPKALILERKLTLVVFDLENTGDAPVIGWAALLSPRRVPGWTALGGMTGSPKAESGLVAFGWHRNCLRADRLEIVLELLDESRKRRAQQALVVSVPKRTLSFTEDLDLPVGTRLRIGFIYALGYEPGVLLAPAASAGVFWLLAGPTAAAVILILCSALLFGKAALVERRPSHRFLRAAIVPIAIALAGVALFLFA